MKIEELELERKIAEKLELWDMVIKKTKEIEKLEKSSGINSSSNGK